MPPYCTQCGHAILATDLTCGECGAPRLGKGAETPEVAPSLPAARPIAYGSSSAYDPHAALFARERWLLPALSATVVGAIIAFALISGAAGRLAESRYQSAIRHLPAYGIRAELIRYDRGWFSSIARVNLLIGGDSIRLRQTIHHFPFPLHFGTASAVPLAFVVDTDIVPPDRRALETLAEFHPHIRSIITLGGAVDTRISLRRLGLHDANSSNTSIVGRISADCYVGRDEQYLSIATPGIALKSGGARISLGRSSLSIKAYASNSGITVARVNTSVQRFDLYPASRSLSYDPGLSDIFIRNFSFSAFNSVSDGFMTLGVDSTVAGSYLGGGRLETRLTHIDLEAVRGFRPFWSRLLKLSDGRIDRPLPEGLLQTIVASHAHLSTHLHLSSANGTTAVHLELNTVSGPNARPYSNAPLASHLASHGRVNIPEYLAAKLVGQNTINKAVAQGFVIQVGKQLMFSYEYHFDHLTMNGRPVHL